MEFLSNLDFARLVPEILLVVIFIWFVLEMMKRFDAKEVARDQIFLTFLREERENRREGMTRLAEELKQTNVLIAANNAVLSSHDARMTTAAERILQAVDPKKPRN